MLNLTLIKFHFKTGCLFLPHYEGLTTNPDRPYPLVLFVIA